MQPWQQLSSQIITPMYISEMLIPTIIHYGLRSQDDSILVVPRTKRKILGDVAKLCNSLPKDVRSGNDDGVFKSKLKIHYFNVAYN